MEEKLTDCFANVGIILDENDKDIPLIEIIQDSLALITLIVEVESFFEVEIPEEYLLLDEMQTFREFVMVIQNLISKNQ